ncbi:invasion protein [Shigella sonnei]|nr:invasion protein [Shigella sonnei]EFW7535998.1 invasion protein [Shigella sonnei]EFX8681935.1 invasion protein [Shigella sonnei]EGD8949902.1 invasion protein [Shigella sonnei]EGE1266353.1 invasion protein [Shigella sonnei]
MTWELILDGYSESSYSATPRFAAARLPWFIVMRTAIVMSLNGALGG